MLQGKREVIKHSAAIHIQNNITLEGAWRRVARARAQVPRSAARRVPVSDWRSRQSLAAASAESEGP